MRARVRRGLLAGGSALVGAALLVTDRAPATVAEQRQRLPAAARCSDSIAGVWRAHLYRPDKGRWEINTMELRWNADHTKLTSSYQHHYWNGGPDDSEPPQPPCEPGRVRRLSLSTGEGSLHGDELEVRGTKLGREEDICGHREFTRALGKLTGTVDRDRSEFRSEFSSRFGKHGMVWRRIRCFDEPEPVGAPAPPTPGEPPPPPPTPSSNRPCCSCATPGRG